MVKPSPPPCGIANKKGGPEAALWHLADPTQSESTKSVRSFCWVLFSLR
jgi:hypothetical protein